MLPLLLAASIAAQPVERCAATANVFLDRATVDHVETLADGGCRIDGTARPVAQSHIRFELRLPPPERWSGRYYQIGNGGFAGAIHDPTLAQGEARGDAMAATDTGHSGDAFDASWAPHHRAQVEDYGWRAIKATSDAARRLLTLYYGRAARYHYAIGCSNGGRMALMAAARWPEEWDGVIAGAPANPWTDQFRAFASLQRQLRGDPGHWITPHLLPYIRKLALSQCAAGTVQHGIATTPQTCGSDFRPMRCRHHSAAPCLSEAQLASLDAIRRAGYLPAAMIPADWQRWILAPASAASQLTFADQARSLLSASDGMVPDDTLNVPLSGLMAFEAHGGKILSYFGWADAVIAPMRAVDWYHAVAQQSSAPVQHFYRLFMVPGMTHCQGGEGPTSFGQSLDAPALQDDARHDIRRALEAWVEQDLVPETLTAVEGGHYETRDLYPER